MHAAAATKYRTHDFRVHQSRFQKWIIHYGNDPLSLVIHSGGTAVFMCLLILLVLYYYHWSGEVFTDDLNDTMNSVSDNIENVPFLALDVFGRTGRQHCLMGWQPFPIGYWPGSIQLGCNSNDPASACDKNNRLAARQLLLWKNYGICVLFHTDYYISATCKEGYTQCYYGGCYNTTLGCPLTNITINTTDTGIQLPLSNSGQQFYLHYTSILGLPPINNISYAINGSNCINDHLQPYSIAYPYIRLPPEGCLKYGEDPMSQNLTSQAEHALYDYNQIDYVFDTMPNYTEYTQSRTAYLVAQSLYLYTNNSACLNTEAHKYESKYQAVFVRYYYSVGAFIITYGFLSTMNICILHLGSKIMRKALFLFCYTITTFAVTALVALLASDLEHIYIFFEDVADFRNNKCLVNKELYPVFDDFLAIRVNMVLEIKMLFTLFALTWYPTLASSIFVCCIFPVYRRYFLTKTTGSVLDTSESGDSP
jgi:hypothetical protein